MIATKTSSSNLHYMNLQQRHEELNTINTWNIKGSIGITYNNKNDMFSFEWNNSLQNYTIDLHSPLNLVTISIIGNSKQVSLWKSGKKYAAAATIEGLMQNQLGWSLPISNLIYWIRALPNSSLPIEFKQIDHYNHLVRLQQMNWSIQYLNFIPVNEIDLPDKIIIQSSKVRCKIVVKKWNI